MDLRGKLFSRWRPKERTYDIAIVVILIVAAPFIAFYNLDHNPRPWHDEGGALSIAKTFVQDNVYAMKSSEGYQTYGAIQSVGPTVVVPVALSLKLFGIGLLQGRIIMGCYLLLTLALFYSLARRLFDKWAALLAVVLLIGSPATNYLYWARQVLGEGPALGFFLGGCLLWAFYLGTSRKAVHLLVGLLFGAAMVTKVQYVPIGFGTLAVLLCLDLVYFRQKNTRAILSAALVAGLCLILWWGWQRVYFGTSLYLENISKLNDLARATSGPNPRTIARAILFLFGSQSAHFYYFWGILALPYLGLLSVRRDQVGFMRAFLVVFAALALAYFTFWTVPWPNYALPAAAFTALAVAKLWYDIGGAVVASVGRQWGNIRTNEAHINPMSSTNLLIIDASIALIVMDGSIAFDFAKAIRDNVLA